MDVSNHNKSIIDWANKRPYWEKLIWEYVINNNIVTDDQFNNVFKYFLIENKLITDTETIPCLNLEGLLPDRSIVQKKAELKELRDCNNINAIPSDQVLKFGKEFTLIYGMNGVGKSGYGKLLANACSSKGVRKILPNLRISNSNPSTPSATFVIQGKDDILYELNKTNSSTLKQFSVFDNHSIPIYLNKANSLSFIPSQLIVFDKIIQAIDRIQSIFDLEKENKTLPNPIKNLFNHNETSSVSTFLSTLSFETKKEDFNKIISFENVDNEALRELIIKRDKKLKLDIPKRKKVLNEEMIALNKLNTAFDKLFAFSSLNFIKSLNNLIESFLAKSKLAKAVGMRNFNSDIFKSIGSEKWKLLILTAKELYDLEIPKSKTIKCCILCQQQLDDKAKDLFNTYWDFLQSKAESELKIVDKELNELSKKIDEKLISLPNINDSIYAIKIIKENDPSILEGLMELLSDYQEFLSILKCSIEKKIVSKEIKFNYKLEFITELIIKKKIEFEKLKDPTKEINALNIQIIEYQHKQKVSLYKDSLLSYLNSLIWLSKANTIKLPKTKYTNVRKNIFNEIVAKDYSTIFNNESKQLNGLFDLEVKTRGSNGETLLEINLNFSKGNKLTDVLSEGEQKVSAIADFLTEIQIDKSNSGIIFDDPVTSLDHNRKEKIAERLVKESKFRQVIVFTHDITFFLSVQYFAKIYDIDLHTTTIRKVNNISGIIIDKLPWVSQNVKARKGVLKEMIVKLEKMFKENIDEDELKYKIKTWYELLRESWERAVEERLLKGAIERFAPSIQTQKLKNIEITKELLNEVDRGMTESSNWVHDRASALNDPIADLEQIKEHFDRFEKFIQKCKA